MYPLLLSKSAYLPIPASLPAIRTLKLYPQDHKLQSPPLHPCVWVLHRGLLDQSEITIRKIRERFSGPNRDHYSKPIRYPYSKPIRDPESFWITNHSSAFWTKRMLAVYFMYIIIFLAVGCSTVQRFVTQPSDVTAFIGDTKILGTDLMNCHLKVKLNAIIERNCEKKKLDN